MAYSVWAAGCGLAAGEEWAPVANSASGIEGGVAAMVTPVEAATDGVVFMLVEVDSVGGASALRAEVTSVASESFATLVRGRALREELEKLKSWKDAYKGKTNKSGEYE